MDVTEKDIGDVLTGFLARSDAELFALSEAELASRWYFKHDPELSVAWNLYQFSDCLSAYRASCRRWEEKHNGHCCVVERVRDKYLMPKIKEFEAVLRNRLSA
jgi:uncharacterized protein YdiU (UPF0061 family)